MEKLHNDEHLFTFSYKGVELKAYWNGGQYVSYIFSVDGVELMRGNEYKPSGLHSIDDIKSMTSLLGFMCVQTGDTDEGYFKYHTKKHLVWLETIECENLKNLIADFENGEDTSEYYMEDCLIFEENTTFN